MLKIQSVNHVSEHLSAIYPVYTTEGVVTLNSLFRLLAARLREGTAKPGGDCLRAEGVGSSPRIDPSTALNKAGGGCFATPTRTEVKIAN